MSLISRFTEAGNPLVMSRLITTSLLGEIRAHDQLEPMGVENVLRLLEMYRFDAFRDREPTGILNDGDFADLNATLDSEGFGRLKLALRSAHERFLPGSSIDDFTKQTADLFQPLIDPETPECVREDPSIERFLVVLTEELSSI
jgi:hypothetical protein